MMQRKSYILMGALLCTSLCGNEIQPALPPPPVTAGVVATIGDLLDQPGISLSNKQVIRMGLSRDRSPAYEGVIAYLLTDQVPANSRWDRNGLGPFQVRVIDTEGKEFVRPILSRELPSLIDSPKQDSSRLLFLQWIPVGAIGTYRVQFFTEHSARSTGFGHGAEPTVSAEAVIKAIPPTGPNWSRLRRRALEYEDRTFPSELSYPVEFLTHQPVWPILCGNRPIREWSNFPTGDELRVLRYDRLPLIWCLPDEYPVPQPNELDHWTDWVEDLSADEFEIRDLRTRQLEQLGQRALNLLLEARRSTNDPETLERLNLVIQKAIPALHLQRIGSRLILSGDRIFILHYDHSQFLVRWWLNDRPCELKTFAPKPPPKKLNALKEVRCVHLDLHLSPEALGARPGDRIGVQLAYNLNGTRAIDGEGKVEQSVGLDCQKELPYGDWMPWFSNRVDFVYHEGDFSLDNPPKEEMQKLSSSP